jgi:hypothetical protein
MKRNPPADGALPPRRADGTYRRVIDKLDNRTVMARRVRALTEALTAELGGAPDALTVAAVRNAAELTALAEAARRAALRGKPADMVALVRLEGAASRAVRALQLRAAPARRQPARQTLAEYLREAESSP